MSPQDPCIWRHVPGYDSDSDAEGPEDEDGDLSPRLATILEALADRWMEAPLVPFAPVRPLKAKSKDTCASKTSAASTRFRTRTGAVTTGTLLNRSWAAPTFRLEHNVAPIVRETCVANGLQQVPTQDFCLFWSGPGMKDQGYKDLHEYQRVNHFPSSTELTRKDTMFAHLSEMARDFGDEMFDFIPETFVLPEQAEAFVHAYRSTGGLWIAKPSNAACGRGIFVFRHLSPAQLSLAEQSVISRYIPNPLLIQGLKFDLRVYVVVTQYDPLRAYVYREGLARFASAPYSTEEDSLADSYRHLTNYSINKSSPNFIENAEVHQDNYGHKWSFSALNKHLKCVGADSTLMWSRIMDLVVKTLLAVEPTIGGRTRKVLENSGVCFEIYGFDVLVDDTLKPWILEVNLSPSMQAESPLDWQVKSSLLSDAFNLVGVCNPDARMIRASRARAQLLQARVAHRKMMQDRTSFTGLNPEPKDGKRKIVTRTPNQSALISDTPVVLENLSEGQLKLLARSLQEMGRANNFIRVYPTRRAVERYAPITGCRNRGCRLASQLLSSVLYGPPPVISEALAAIRARAAAAEEARRAGSTLPPTPSWDRGAGPGVPPAALPAPGAKSEGRGVLRRELHKEDQLQRRERAEEQREGGSPVEPRMEEGQGEASEGEQASRMPALTSPGRREAPKPPVQRSPAVSDDEELHDVLGLLVPAGRRAEEEEGGREEEHEPAPAAVRRRGAAAEEDASGPAVDAGAGLFGPTLSSSSSATACAQDLDCLPAPPPASLHCLEALDAGDRRRLLVMEYLLRVSRVCQALTSKERALLAQSASFARLSMFSRRVRAVQAALRAAAARAAPHGGSSGEEDSDMDGGGIADELIVVCRGAVRALALQAWALLADTSASAASPPAEGATAAAIAALRRLDRRAREIGRRLPPEFVLRPVGRGALEVLPSLSDAALEGRLQTMGQPEEPGMLSELFYSSEQDAAFGRPPSRPSSRCSSRFYSPLQELVCAKGQIHVREQRAQLRASTSLPSLRPGGAVPAAAQPSMLEQELDRDWSPVPRPRSQGRGRRWPPAPLAPDLLPRSRPFTTSASEVPAIAAVAASAGAFGTKKAIGASPGRPLRLAAVGARGWDFV